ncbi:MAG: LytR C-terminal domain-containing protein [Eubacterium sp.]|nr:LytR C-terminal domain-containing protein [Eubacterium sp.]
MASKKKKDSTIGMFFSFFLKATVIILGLVILAMSVYLVKQVILQKNSEAENKSDEAVFEDDQKDELMMSSVGDAEVLLYDNEDDKLDGSGKGDIGFDAKIIVLNATETEGLAGAWKGKLEEQGFKNVEVGNYTDGVLESSKIVVTTEKTGGNLQQYLPEAAMETMSADQVPSDVSGDGIAAFFIIGNSDNILAE